jgi:hypothetical protein
MLDRAAGANFPAYSRIHPMPPKTSGGDRAIIAALFDIVNAASQVVRDVTHRACCSATQTRHRQDENHLQIQHDAMRSSSAHAWLCARVPMRAIGPRSAPSFYPAFTERRDAFAPSNRTKAFIV